MKFVDDDDDDNDDDIDNPFQQTPTHKMNTVWQVSVNCLRWDIASRAIGKINEKRPDSRADDPKIYASAACCGRDMKGINIETKNKKTVSKIKPLIVKECVKWVRILVHL